MLERMPVIEKASSGHINGDSAEEAAKTQAAKPRQGEPMLLHTPANQVTLTLLPVSTFYNKHYFSQV